MSSGTAQQEAEKAMTALVAAGLGKGDGTLRIGPMEAALRKREKSNEEVAREQVWAKSVLGNHRH